MQKKSRAIDLFIKDKLTMKPKNKGFGIIKLSETHLLIEKITANDDLQF